MRKTKKILSLVLSTMLCVCSLFTACGEETANAPDYSKNTEKYPIWAYSQTCDDWYQVDGVRTYFEDGTRQTMENTQLSADAGFTVLFIDWTFPYQGPINFETSKLKQVMDYAHAAGMKAFIFTGSLHSLSAKEESLINPAKADGQNFFASQEELNAYVAEYLAPLQAHPAFYGCSLRDEPKYTMFEAMGQVYRAIQAAAPGCFVNMNINPMYDGLEYMYCKEGTSIGLVKAYKKYLDTYYEHIGQYANYIQYDDYPILEGKAILAYHLQNAKIVADYCKEKGMTFGKVFQTCAYGADLVRVAPTKRDMLWQMNIGMAMGIKNYSYYTYYPVVNSGGLPDETATIVNRLGTPNERYYWLKDIHEDMHFNAKALLNFEYQALNVLTKTPIPGNKAFLQGVINASNKLTDIKSIAMDSAGIILTTEQYDEANDQRGYYVMNATAPSQATEIKVTIELETHKNVQIWDGNKATNQKVKNGQLSFYLQTGEGVFIMPY